MFSKISRFSISKPPQTAFLEQVCQTHNGFTSNAGLI